MCDITLPYYSSRAAITFNKGAMTKHWENVLYLWRERYTVHLNWYRFFEVCLLLDGLNVFCCCFHQQLPTPPSTVTSVFTLLILENAMWNYFSLTLTCLSSRDLVELVMEAQISSAWIDSAWPKLPAEKPLSYISSPEAPPLLLYWVLFDWLFRAY